MRRKQDLRAYVPAEGFLSLELKIFCIGLLLSVLYSLRFWMDYHRHYPSLFHDGIPKSNVQMMEFKILSMNSCFLLFGVLALLMLVFIVLHYDSFYRESKSIYLMRRLPDRWELHRRCLTMPILLAFASLLCRGMVILLYFGIYCLLTPDVCLEPGQWQQLWQVLF